MKRRAVFLDRDGVINRAVIREGKPYPPSSIAELQILPGVQEAIRRLNAAGFQLIVVTNQPDVARGKQTRENVEEINGTIMVSLSIEDFRVCYHDDADYCACRKPKPGLLLEAARDHQIDLTASFMIGDRWRDIEAGESAGCITIFVDHEYEERRPDRFHAKVKSLAEAAEWILSNERGESFHGNQRS